MPLTDHARDQRRVFLAKVKVTNDAKSSTTCWAEEGDSCFRAFGMLTSCHSITDQFKLHVQAQQLPPSSMQACILTVSMPPASLQALICNSFCRAITR